MANGRVHVNNVPAYAEKYKYWVCRTDTNQLWFYGAWDNFDDALKVAREVHGVVIENEGY